MKKNTYISNKFTKKLCSLMESSSYKSWLQAWILVRDKVSEDITTFSQFDSMLGIDKYGYSLNDMLYELEMALHNEGLEDLYFMEQRAELAHWIYTYFTDETELNLANYRAFEAESVCELDDIDRAELLIKELIQLYPKSSIGYVIWADFYWSSDWSYQYGENYEKAESIYHRALSIKGLNDYVAIEGNLKAMLYEKEHPEERARIKQYRLKRINVKEKRKTKS